MAISPENVGSRLKQFLDKGTSIAPSAYIHERAVIVGDVRLGANVSVWPCAVLRGDINYIEVGEGTNIQDGAVLHLADDHPVIIGKYVTIGHMAMVHACTIGDECLIGMNAVILSGAVIGKNSIIGAGALIKEHEVIPEGSLVVGNPGRIARVLDSKRREEIKSWAQEYIELAKGYKARGI
jgi:carbonic anhydrase/acetyltransferase-like protein (isoleucine patch superfamily)